MKEFGFGYKSFQNLHIALSKYMNKKYVAYRRKVCQFQFFVYAKRMSTLYVHLSFTAAYTTVVLYDFEYYLNMVAKESYFSLLRGKH